MNCIKCNSLLNPRWGTCLVCGEPTTESKALEGMPMEPGSGSHKWIMESPILGRVSLGYDPKEPDAVMVDGVAYGRDEIRNLISRGIGNNGLKRVHDVKKQFEGEVR